MLCGSLQDGEQALKGVLRSIVGHYARDMPKRLGSEAMGKYIKFLLEP